jgi:hypothetical protein
MKGALEPYLRFESRRQVRRIGMGKVFEKVNCLASLTAKQLHAMRSLLKIRLPTRVSSVLISTKMGDFFFFF